MVNHGTDSSRRRLGLIPNVGVALVACGSPGIGGLHTLLAIVRSAPAEGRNDRNLYSGNGLKAPRPFALTLPSSCAGAVMF